MIMTKLRTSCSGKSYICMYLWQYSCVLFSSSVCLACVTVLGYWKQLWDAIVNNTGIVDDSRCMHNSNAVGCMYNRVQNSCNRHSRRWKPQLRKGITTCCLLQDFCKVIPAKMPTDLQLCSCRLYIACHCYG